MKVDALKGQYCESCRHWHNPSGSPLGMCIIRPPAMFILGMAPTARPVIAPRATPEMGPIVQSFYPQVGPKDGCHDHARVEALN